MLLTHLVELGEEPGHDTDHILRLHFVAVVVQAWYLSVQQGNVLKLVHDLLIVLDTLEHVLRYELWKDLFSTFDFNINYAVIIVDFARPHFSSMDHNHEK